MKIFTEDFQLQNNFCCSEPNSNQQGDVEILGFGEKSDHLMLEFKIVEDEKMSEHQIPGLDFRKAEEARRKQSRQAEESIDCISKCKGTFLRGFLCLINKYLQNIQLWASHCIYKDGVPLWGCS